jgi:hypothetical protein
MSRRRRVLLLWGLLATLAAVIVYVESRPDGPEEDPYARSRLLGLHESDLGQIDLFYQGRLATLMRSPGGRWFIHDSSHSHSLVGPALGAGPPAEQGQAPPAAPAPVPPPVVPSPSAPAEAHPEPDEAQARKLARSIELVAQTEVHQKLTPELPLREYGLENPPIAVLMYNRTQDGSPSPRPLAALYVGGLLPSRLNYYAQVVGQREIAVISLYHVDALIEAAFGINPNPQKAPLPEGRQE